MLSAAIGSTASQRGKEGAAGGSSRAARLVVYGAFLLSGATALMFEVLWSRQFVTLFGASTYAISAVLCAFMAGLGVGGWLGGRLADQLSRRLLIYGVIQGLVGLWAAGIPVLLAGLRRWAPSIALLGPGSVLLSVAGRFAISFAILFVPCVLMGATLPVLSRFCIESREVIGARVSLLYGLNTLGATLGCFASGYWLIDTFGLSVTNWIAVATNLLIAAVAVAFGLAQRGQAVALPSALSAELIGPPGSSAVGPAEEREAPARGLLLAIAVASGLAGLCCEVLWLRYLMPLSNMAYTFTTVLGIYLLGVGIGSLLYRFCLARLGRPLQLLAGVEFLLGLSVVVCFLLSAFISSSREAGPLGLWGMSALTVLAPTIAMGAAFPLICAAYARSVATAGRGIGIVYALNTVGTIAGSLLPVFVLVPAIGIQKSILLAGFVYWTVGAALLLVSARGRALLPLRAACGGTLLVIGAVGFLVPGDLCRRAILSTGAQMGRHREVIFYSEGKTSTEAIVQDKVSALKYLYMNGAIEVTTAYPEMVCFKLMAAVGPLLHAKPEEVLMVCFGGGIASGAAVQYPDVRSVLAVDLEASVLEGARLLERENNSVLNNPKARVVIDDGRNYILMAGRRWPVIVCDSIHPKSSDSWVLYTQEFYQTIKDHLTEDGLLAQWIPFQRLSVAEYKSIVRTFQSVFPHTSLWFTDGVSETGLHGAHTLLVGTPERLSVDLTALKQKLSAPQVSADLRPWGMDSPVGILETFVCGEDRLREWTGQGPINTDDLPYVQYKTKYSAGPECTSATFGPLLESIWPYVGNAGAPDEAEKIERELALHMEANSLVLANRHAQALALLPQDPKLRQYQDNLALGVQWIWKASEYYRDRPLALILLAGRAMAIPGNWGQAVTLYERALALDPDNAVAHQNLGSALASQGRLDEAITHYRKALRLEPRSAVTHSNLGTALAGRGRLDEAIEELTEALRLDPSLARAHCSMGGVLARQGRYEEAAVHFSEALKIDPDYAAARDGLSLARRK